MKHRVAYIVKKKKRNLQKDVCIKTCIDRYDNRTGRTQDCSFSERWSISHSLSAHREAFPEWGVYTIQHSSS